MMLPPPFGHHFWQRGLNHPILRADVEVESKIPVFVRRLHNRAVVHKTCAVKQHIKHGFLQSTQLNGGFVHHVQHGGGDVVYTR